MKTLAGAAISLLCFYSALSRGCHDSDRVALLAFKVGITADPSGLLGTWNPATDCCSAWNGIACDPATARVTALSRPGLSSGPDGSITDATIDGILSPALANLSALRLLDLSNLKRLSGPIPTAIARIPHLTHLLLGSNNLSGDIPDDIGKLHGLASLDLSSNRLSGGIPGSIGELANLTLLYLNDNHLTGSIPNSISGMLSLQFCRMSNNRLTGHLPDGIGALRSLQRLLLNNNRLEGELPNTIGSLAMLTDLFLSGNRLSGRFPAGVGNMTGLMTLDLSRNCLSGPIPRELSMLPRLRDLDLSFNTDLLMTGPPTWLSEMSLFSLMLAGTSIAGPLPDWLANATTISILDLSSNRLASELPSWIGDMAELSFLNLSNNRLAGELPIEFQNLTMLMDLDLHGNRLTGPLRPVVTKSTLEQLGSYRTLDLSSNGFTGGINDNIGELPAMSTVERLVLSHNPQLGGRIPESMGRMAGLKEVEMAGNGLSGEIPAAVLDVEYLVVFDVSENRLTGQIPSHRSRLPAKGFRGNPGLCGDPLQPCRKL